MKFMYYKCLIMQPVIFFTILGVAYNTCDAKSNLCVQTSIIESIVEDISDMIGGCTVCDELSIIDSKIDELLIEDLCDATPITAPIMITQSGSYCLANDIVGTVTIAADNVNLNLNNYVISSATNGIESMGQNFITIQNGTIHAVDYGILFTDVASSKIVNCDFQICGTGCGINQSQQIIIDNCRAEANRNGFSFVGSVTCVVRNSIALDHTVDGFLFDSCFGTVVTDCIATGNTVGYRVLDSFNSFFGNVIGNANGFHGLHSINGANLRIESSSFDFNTGLLTGVNLRGSDPVQTCSGNGVTTTDTSTASGNNVSTSNNNGDGTSNLLLAKGYGNFTNWRANGNGGNGVTVTSSNNVTYEGHFRNNGQCGIAGDSNSGLTLNLTAEGNQGLAAVQVTNTSNLIMSGNYSNNVGTGAILGSCPGATVNQCTVNNNGGHGIDVDSSSGFLIQNATVTSSGQNGINVTGSQNGQLTGNTVSSSVGHGIFYDSATTNCTTNNCTALSNGGTGIYNMGGTSNALYANNAKSNSTNFDGVNNKYVAINETQNRNSDLDILSDVNNLPPQTIVINNPGVYTMTRTFSGQIIINASNVTLDLGGNTIIGDSSTTVTSLEMPVVPAGIINVLPGAENRNINIRNGNIQIIDDPYIIYGIDVEQTDKVTITDMIVHNTSTLIDAIGINVAGTDISSINNFFMNNISVSNKLAVAGLLFGVQIQYCNDVTIEQLITSSNVNIGLNIVNSVNGAIEDCFISNNGNTGIALNNSQQYVIKNCTLSGNMGSATGAGIALLNGCSACTISNCTATNNTIGINIQASSVCRLIDCTANQNFSGVTLNGSSQCIIDNCTAVNSVSYGFLIEAESNFNLIKNCTATAGSTEESFAGIDISQSNSNIISYCEVSNFFYGIHIELTSANCSIENCKAIKNDTGIILDDAQYSEVKSCISSSNSVAGFQDASPMSLNDRFMNNIAHTNGGGLASNYISIAPTTTDQVNGGFYNNLSL